MIEIKGNAKLAKKLQKEECNQANLSKKECNKSLRLFNNYCVKYIQVWTIIPDSCIRRQYQRCDDAPAPRVTKELKCRKVPQTR